MLVVNHSTPSLNLYVYWAAKYKLRSWIKPLKHLEINSDTPRLLHCSALQAAEAKGYSAFKEFYQTPTSARNLFYYPNMMTMRFPRLLAPMLEPWYLSTDLGSFQRQGKCRSFSIKTKWGMRKSHGHWIQLGSFQPRILWKWKGIQSIQRKESRLSYWRTKGYEKFLLHDSCTRNEDRSWVVVDLQQSRLPLELLHQLRNDCELF